MEDVSFEILKRKCAGDNSTRTSATFKKEVVFIVFIKNLNKHSCSQYVLCLGYNQLLVSAFIA